LLRGRFDGSQDAANINATFFGKVVVGFLWNTCMGEDWGMVRPARSSNVDASLFTGEMLLLKYSTDSIGTGSTYGLNGDDLKE
jgi:hypothetical protein